MLHSPLVICGFLAILWGGYQLLIRTTEVPPLMVALYVVAFGLIPVGAANIWSGAGISGTPRQIGLLMIAGIMFGSGMILYASLLTNRELDLSIWAPIAAVTITATVIVGTIVFFGESVTPARMVGFVLALAALWFLK